MRFIFTGLAVATCTFASANLQLSKVPRLLIVPEKAGLTADASPVSIGNYLAQELDQDGRVRAIVWSLTDPTFRDARDNGVLRAVKNEPNKQEGEIAAKALGAQYLLLYTAKSGSKGLSAHAELYFNGKLVWKDVENSASIRSGSVNSEDSNASIAHTWNIQLVAAALKSLTPHPKVLTPSLGRGQEPPKSSAVQPPPSDPTPTLAAKADEFIKANHPEKAINLVRDAIDAKPFDATLRLLLVNIYEGQKDWAAAADAAKRGSEVIPDNMDLRKASLRDLISSGKGRDAQDEINEILARQPNSSSNQLLESQTFLVVGEYEKATLALDQVVKKSPTSDSYYWRAVARAALGGADGVNQDVQQYLKKPFPEAEMAADCQESEKVLARVTTRDVEASLAFFQQVAVQPGSPQNQETLDQLTNCATARSNFLQQIPASTNYRQSYGALLLAQKLLIASFASLKDFLKTNSDDSMTDARINLGEAIKSVKSSQKLLLGEQGSNDIAKPVVDLR